MRAYLIGGAIAVLGLATAAAAAQPAPPPGVAQGTTAAPVVMPPPPGPPHVRVMFGDHVTTRAEVAEHVGKMFAKLDTNHDGFITKEEIDALHAKMDAKMDAAMAKMGDVHKRLAESGIMMGDRGQIFDQLDTNHDGNISRQEFTASRPEVRERRVFVMREGGAAGARMRMHRMGMGGFGGNLFDMADANKDGRVSLAEAQAAALAHFDQADVNRDGRITPDERREMRHVRIERRGS